MIQMMKHFDNAVQYTTLLLQQGNGNGIINLEIKHTLTKNHEKKMGLFQTFLKMRIFL